jgi:hypothetical protein
LVALAGALAVAVIGAGAVLAQEGGDGGSRPFLDRVAEKLGIDRGELDDAIRDARSDEIDDAVEDGDLSPEQAERLRERLDGLPEGGPFFPPGLRSPERFEFKEREGRPQGPGRGLPFGDGLTGIGDGLAEFLGVPVEQLREELSAEGATIAGVAESHGKSRDEVKDYLAAQAREKLDEAVEAGWLSGGMADAFADMLDGAIDVALDAPVGDIWSGFRRFHEEFRPLRPDMDGERDGAPERDNES